jgi:hypothetical protein
MLSSESSLSTVRRRGPTVCVIYKVITHDERLEVRGLGVCGAEPRYGR